MTNRQRTILTLARFRAAIWRFHTHPYAEAVMASVGDPGVVSRRFAGGSLALEVRRSTAHRLLLLEGERYVSERHLLRSLLREGDTAVDVGANVGYVSLLLARAVTSSGRVLCCEPDPSNLVELRRNLESNRIDWAEIHPCAIGENSGSIEMTAGLNARVLGEGNLTVRLCTLDEAANGPVDFIKVDVEGYELEVLRGAARTLTESRPNLFVEVHVGMLGRSRFDEVMSLLRVVDPNLRAYRPATNRFRALVGRYFTRLGLEILEEPEGIADREPITESTTFWVTCRPRLAAGRATPP